MGLIPTDGLTGVLEMSPPACGYQRTLTVFFGGKILVWCLLEMVHGQLSLSKFTLAYAAAVAARTCWNAHGIA